MAALHLVIPASEPPPPPPPGLIGLKCEMHCLKCGISCSSSLSCCQTVYSALIQVSVWKQGSGDKTIKTYVNFGVTTDVVVMIGG